MITILNIIRIIVFALIVPVLLGNLVCVLYKKENCGIAENAAYGFMLMCLLFFLIAVPMIFLHTSFHALLYLWFAVLAVLCMISVYLRVKRRGYKEIAESARCFFKEVTAERFTTVIWVAAAFIILFEACLPTFTMHVDTDDSRFIAEALEAVEKDTMIQYHAITGKYLGFAPGEQTKDMTSPYPIFIALLSRLYGLHPAITAHTVLPFLFIILSYIIFYMIGGVLLGTDIRKRGLFLLFLSLIIMFFFETIYASGYTLLTIIWQGRSVCAMITLPFLWYLLMLMSAKERMEKVDYIMLIGTALCNTMTSNMGSILAPCLITAYAFAKLIKGRRIVPCLFMCLCTVPSFACVLITRIMRTFLERL